MKYSVKKERLKCIAMDYIASLAALILFNIFRYYILQNQFTGVSLWKFLCYSNLRLEELIFPPLMLGIYWLSGYYNRPIHRSRIQEGIVTFFSSAIISIIFFVSFLTNDMGQSVRQNLLLILAFFLSNLILVYIGRLIMTSLALKKLWNKEWVIRTLIIGNTRTAHQIEQKMSKSRMSLGWNIIGFIDIPGEEGESVSGRTLGHIEDVEMICKKNHIDQCIIVPGNYDENKVMEILPKLLNLNIPIRVAADMFSIVTSGIRLQDIFSEPFIDITRPMLSESGQNIKRTLDVFLSGIALLLLAIPMLVIAIAVKATSPGPVFYTQSRLGLHRREFRIYKFRSMYTDAEADGPQLSHKEDKRVTPIGRILRKYRLDEIPQFWNVLKGDMSIVGPRPEREYYVKEIQKHSPYYPLVHQVKPGITSWGMVKYGYASDIQQMVIRSKYDIIYLSSMSLIIDLKIMIYTIKTVLTGRGI